MAKIDSGVLQARIQDGVLQVCRYFDGKPAEEWREPYEVAEIAAILPQFARNSMAEGVQNRDLISQIGEFVEKIVDKDRKPRTATVDPQGVGDDGAWADGEPEGTGMFGGRDMPPVPDLADRVALYPRSDRAGAQFIPHLLAGGKIVAPDALAKLVGSQLVLRFNYNSAKQEPQVALFVDGKQSEDWRTPTAAECSSVSTYIAPETSAREMVALFAKKGDEDVRFVGWQPAVEGATAADRFRERIPAGLFDTLCDERHLLASSFDSSSGECSVRLFVKNAGDTSLTNMQQNGCLGSDQTFVMRKLRAEVKLASGFIGEARKAALAAVRAGMELQPTIGCKPFLPAPPDLVPGAEDNAATYSYAIGGDVGLAVPARQNFAVDVRLSAAARELLSIPGTRVRVWLEGELTRDVQ